MNKQILSALKVSALAVVLSFGISYALAWVAPSVAPPNGNVAAPINTSATAQTKLGPFTIGTTTATSTLTVIGNVNTTGDVCTSTTGTAVCLGTLATPVTLVFTPASVILQSGATTTFSWTATGLSGTTTPCTASGSWSGSKAASGSFTTSPVTGPITNIYTLSCTGVGWTTAQQSATVQIIAPYSVTYQNGAGGWVTIAAGVTKVKFQARGGSGSATGGGFSNTGGGGSAFAYYGSNVPILSVGGGGGGGGYIDYVSNLVFNYAGGAGGYTGGSIEGGGGDGYNQGSSGSASSGGSGGNATGTGGFSAGAGGGGGGNSSGRGGSGGNGSLSHDGLYYSGVGAGTGGAGYLASGNGGAGSNGVSAGGGGGYSGAGGGGGTYIDTTSAVYESAGGGGGSGYLLPGLSSPDVNGYVTLLLSTIGSPSQVYLGTGSGGSSLSGNNGSSGSITMSW